MNLRFLLVTSLLGVLAIACDLGGSELPDLVKVPADGDETEDPPPPACDPVAETGCRADQRCTWVRLAGSPPTGATACVADGTVPLGGACTRGRPGWDT